MSLINRLLALLKRDELENNLDDELKFHVEMKTREYVAEGMSPQDARAAALRQFGNVMRTKETARSAWSFPALESILQDIRYGLRQLRRNPGFTAVAVLTLGLGIGANTAIFSLIDAVMLRMLPVERSEELMQVQYGDPSWSGEGVGFTNPLWEQVRDRQDVFSGVFAWGTEKFDLARGGAAHFADGIWVSGDFFNTLRLRPAAGRLISNADDQRDCRSVTVLSYGFWQDRYGMAHEAIGSTLSLNNHPFEVIGVAPPGFFGMNVGEKFDVAVPICSAAILDGKEGRLDSRSWWWLNLAGRLSPGTSRRQATARLKVLSPSIFAAAMPQDWSADMQRDFEKHTLAAAPGSTGLSGLRRQFKEPMLVLMAVVGLVLLIACANIAGLILTRAAARTREIAVRQALGAGRLRLIRQLLTECVLLSAAGAILGVLFANWGAAVLVHYISTWRNAVYLDLSLDGRVLGFTAAVAALSCILFGLSPALRSSKVSLVSAMQGNRAREGERPGRLRAHKWIVSSQLALSLVLLVGAGLLLRSFAKLATLDVGFDRNNVVLVRADLKTAKVPPERQLATFEQIEARLGALPGVGSVGRSVITPISGAGWNEAIRTDWSKALKGDDVLSWFNCVSPGYFQTLRIPLLAGRNFGSGDTKTSPPVAIINQTLARRFFPNLNPLGKTFRRDDAAGKPGPPIEVVGLVEDAQYTEVRAGREPTAFLPATQLPEMFQTETFELRTTIPPSALVRPVQAAVADVNKEVPLEFHTLAEQVSDSLVQERLLAVLSAFFGFLALVLAMVGLYGAISYMVTQRQAEFGIRMALGAPSRQIFRLVMVEVAAILATGILTGALIAFATTRVLQKLLFGLDARDPVTLAGAAVLLSAVAVIAGYFPARRATKVDPMVALRYE
jgi:putative ABC transport system permease protein